MEENKEEKVPMEENKEEKVNNSSDLQYALVFHGGAGNISTRAHDIKARMPLFDKLKDIITQSHNYCELGLKGKLTAMDIVEKVIILMENSPFFNAGKGSVFNKSGKHEMEASIMNGKDLKCGAVSLLNNLKNPISAAIDIMNTTNHIYLVGNGAIQHLKDLLLDTSPNNYYDTTERQPPQFENNKYFYTNKRWNSYQKMKQKNETELITKAIRSEDEDQLNSTHFEGYDGMDDIFEGNTVGCAVMLRGNVAAGTSTGGMTYKLNGRIGDAPIIGSGTYADNKYGAITCTGSGESFMKHVSGYDVIARVKYCKISLQKAIEDHLNEYFEIGTGGAVSVNNKGEFGIAFNTTGMIRGYFNSNNKFGNIAILKDDTKSVYWNENKNEQKTNPYLDNSLIQASQKFSPIQNKQFVSSHKIDRIDINKSNDANENKDNNNKEDKNKGNDD